MTNGDEQKKEKKILYKTYVGLTIRGLSLINVDTSRSIRDSAKFQEQIFTVT